MIPFFIENKKRGNKTKIAKEEFRKVPILGIILIIPVTCTTLAPK